MKNHGRWIVLAASLLAMAGGRSEERTRPGGDVVSGQQIEQALAEKPRTRGLVIRANVESKGTSAESPQTIDLNIPFQLNSSELQPQAVVQLGQLEAALKSPTLGKYRFLVAGHTDATGNAGYNRQLSLRRAESVKRYLVARGVNPARLESAGYGKDRPLTPADPDNPANRRVEIRNLGESP
jgi:outer membrane protein OmpA-like peptidoglycan-associated protein